MSVGVVAFGPNGVRYLEATDEEAAILFHWRTLSREGQMVVTKREGRLEHCELKTFHTRTTFMGVDKMHDGR